MICVEKITAREERFPMKEDWLKEFEESTLFDDGADLTFGGFWFVNFANLRAKNQELLADLHEDRKRAKSF